MATWREEKRRYRQYQARKEQLPADHRRSLEAVERYALRTGAVGARGVVPLLEALVETYERAVADGTSVDEMTGGDPVAFAEAYLQDHSTGSWVARERRRLADAVAAARPVGTGGV